MASVFKTFLNNDITTTRTLLHENIPITGSLLSGSYTLKNTSRGEVFGSDQNIKKFTHGHFISVYDYPYLSSSANHIMDITAGFSSVSAFSSSATIQQKKKINVYNQMAQILMGHDVNGNIQRFDRDGDLVGGVKINEAVFFNFSRLLVKDEIKKGSFTMEFGVSASGSLASATGTGTAFLSRVRVADTNAASSFFVNSPTGEYGILTASNSTAKTTAGVGPLAAPEDKKDVGLIFYQAGVAVVTASLFVTASNASNFGTNSKDNKGLLNHTASQGVGGKVLWNTTGSSNQGIITSHNMGAADRKDIRQALNSETIANIADGARQRIYNISFNNTTELNSTIYFCRIGHNEFNYSSNPTYLNGSKIRVKNEATDAPRTYITTVGLYSADNELLAVAKLSEPLRKDPSTELTLRVRLDY